MSEWKEVELGKIANVKGGKRLPIGSDLTDIPTAHPYIRTRDINGNQITISELLFVPNDVFPSISNYIVEAGDVIISIVGTIGACAIIPEELHLASLTENCAKIVDIDATSLDRQFLFYYLISADGQAEIISRNVGSTQPKLPLYNIKSTPIPLPPLPEQRAIAAVLAALDDKIDLLHRQNRTLESLAQALFRHWFSDGAGEDWEEGTLGDLVEFHYGKGLKSAIRTGEGFPVVGSSGVVDYHSEFLVEAPGIVIGRKGTLGEVIYLSDNFFPIDTTYFVKSKNDSPGLYFEYFLLKSIDFKEMNTDSAVPGLNRTIALGTEVALPPQAEIARFNELAHPLLQKTITNKSQIRTLAALRDSLLPKLMSGEVRVRV